MLDLNALISTLVNNTLLVILLYFGVTKIVDRWLTHKERILAEITRQIALQQGINVFEYEYEQDKEEEEENGDVSLSEEQHTKENVQEDSVRQVHGYQAQR